MNIKSSAFRKKALLILVLVMLIRLIWIPAMTWQEEALSRIAQLQKGLAKLESLEKNRGQLESTVQSSEECLGNLEAFFHPGSTTPEALQLEVQKSLDDLAKQSGLKVERVEWLYVNEDEFMIRTPLRIVFRSSLSQLYNYIFQVESQPHFYTVDSMQLSQLPKGELHGTLEISAYNLVPKKEK